MLKDNRDIENYNLLPWKQLKELRSLLQIKIRL